MFGVVSIVVVDLPCEMHAMYGNLGGECTAEHLLVSWCFAANQASYSGSATRGMKK